MKQKKGTVLQIIIFLGLAAILIYWQYTAMNEAQRDKMITAISGVRWGYALPVLIVGFLSHYFRALRWKLLLRPLDIRPATANVTFAVLIGYLVNALVPRLGEVAKCTVLARYEKVPADKMVGTILAERAFDLVCLLLLFGLTFATQYSVISPYAEDLYRSAFLDQGGNFIWNRILLAITLIAIGTGIFVLIYRKIRNTKAGGILKSIGEGLRTVAHIRQRGLFILYTLLIWWMYVTMAIIGFYALPGTEDVPALAGLSVVAFGSIGMIVTPGGIGAYPPIAASILLLYGISIPIGNAYGWVSWAAQTGVVLILGLVSLVLLPVYNRKKYDQQERIDTE